MPPEDHHAAHKSNAVDKLVKTMVSDGAERGQLVTFAQ
jgi:hypothetical protein